MGLFEEIEQRKNVYHYKKLTVPDEKTEALRILNINMIKVLDGNGLSLSEKDKVRLPRLNLSSDFETVMLVHNILKEKYHVDIQREGIQA